jgi:hypothetical protein
MNIKGFRHKQALDEISELGDIDLSDFTTILREDEMISCKPDKPRLSLLTRKELIEASDIDFEEFSVLIRENNELNLLDESFQTILRAGEIGAKGEKGDAGRKGDTGERGEKGDVGPIGLTGATGEKGDKGDQGNCGVAGPAGKRGERGHQGDAGIQGIPGPHGPRGSQGIPGSRGEKGDRGEVGPQGEKGEKGETGETGLVGPQGDDGPQGKQGIPGPRGHEGSEGKIGPAGKDGARGEKGECGDEGPKGPRGERGAKGPAGDSGRDGIDGERGETGPAGERGERGEQGHQGIPGPPGAKGDRGEQGIAGPIGPAPKHKYSSGVLSFETAPGKYDTPINLKALIEKAAKAIPQPKAEMIGGGGSNLDFVIGNSIQRAELMNFDSSSLIVTNQNGVITIGVNPAFVPNPGTGTGSSVEFTFWYHKMVVDNEYVFTLPFTPILNSETVIMNGLVMTEGLDYTINGAVISLDSRHQTKATWNITVKYAKLPTTGIGQEAIPIEVY